jgi:hypothetical protein
MFATVLDIKKIEGDLKSKNLKIKTINFFLYKLKHISPSFQGYFPGAFFSILQPVPSIMKNF